MLGRLHGGTAILWNKLLHASPVYNDDSSIIGLDLKMSNSALFFINVYLPYCSPANTDNYINYLSKIYNLFENINNPNLCILGDFNACKKNGFGVLLSNFCKNNNLIVSDEIFLPQDTFTYVSDCHGSTSWIDHCLSSSSFHQAITEMDILQDFFTSDHRPLAFTLHTPNLPQLEDHSVEIPNDKVNWDKVSSNQKYEYSLLCKELLSQIHIADDILDCKDPLCKNPIHIDSIANFYNQIVEALKYASNQTLKFGLSKKSKKKYITGWNHDVKKAHKSARLAYLNWIKYGKTRHGKLYEMMKSTRKSFKYALRKCRKNKDSHKANALATSLLTKSTKVFWKKIKASKKSHTLPSSINNVNGVEKITDMWKQHFSSILNSSGASTEQSYINEKLNLMDSYNNLSLFLSSSDMISPLLYKLKCGCAAGADGITAEHFHYCDNSISLSLSILFNMCLIHGFLPKPCLETIIVPIIKNPNNNIQDVSNYRPIAVATVISKLFELFILHLIKDFIKTSDNQFGFKSNHSTDMSVFLFKQAVSSYVSHKTPVFAVFLDASKAFDKVRHDILFKKLMVRNVPMHFVRLLCYWYKTQTMKVKWGKTFSDSFSVSNGVRQGGILSPYLFSIYLDDLSQKLNTVRAGCYIGNVCLNHIMFADDICVFSPSLLGVQDLLNVCHMYAMSHHIDFNHRKSFGMTLALKSFTLSLSPKLLLGNSTINFTQQVNYLGLIINDNLNDDDDILRQTRSLYCIANKLKYNFNHCNIKVKKYLFQHYCPTFYGSHLWCEYRNFSMNRLRVAYNDSYRILHNLPRSSSARAHQVQSNILTFDALIRKYIFSFISRCLKSENIFISSLMSSDVWYKSKYHDHYLQKLFI